MPQTSYADIVFPTPVRKAFTYSIPEAHAGSVQAGMRVWVPLRRHNAIGMVVRVHDETPDFNTRPLIKPLDEQPVIDPELLKLTEWMHRFYYAGWGETIQAALPVGLNFFSEEVLQVGEHAQPFGLSGPAGEIFEAVQEKGQYPLKDARRRWAGDAYEGMIDKLIGQKLLEVWERPSVKITQKMEKLWSWSDKADAGNVEACIEQHTNSKGKPKWIKALEVLRAMELPRIQPELTEHELLEYYTLNRIREEGLIEMDEVPAHQVKPRMEYDPGRLKKLNEQQQQAYEAILEPVGQQDFQSFLLYGVTGSGKTEVYIHALRKVMEQGRGGLILVPEIGLTPQTVRRFYQIFGDQIAVLHSRLSDRERYDAWQALRKGEKKIAIGARSAVFAPVQNLGLIIVDEEHDSSYKQEDPAPRYHARDVAIMRAYLNKGVVVMGSATPSMIALHGAEEGKHQLLRLPSRHARARLPEVHILDLKQYKHAMRGPVAVPLYQAVEKALERREQIILLYNRRGHSSYLQCEGCGQIRECLNCSVSLTYHKKFHQLRCHYCGYACSAHTDCPECGSSEQVPQGAGTQKIEEEVGELFPEAGVLRLDQDTTSAKNAHEELLGQFGRGEADILLGTQIVAKGLDFPNVTVVGVINADTELAFPSFRSGERMYQLLSQVAGRSGRAEKEGVVYFQTWQPDHPALQCAREHDHARFAQKEMAFRRELSYPPFSRLMAFYFRGREEQKVQEVAEAFTLSLIDAGGGDGVLGPSPAAISRMNRDYRWECLLKIKPSNGAGAIEKLIDRTFEIYEQRKPKGSGAVRITVNVDAIQ